MILPKSTPTSSAGPLALLLIVMGCTRGLPSEKAATTGSPADVLQELARDYSAYERGRRAEITALHGWLARSDTVRGEALDQAGADAAGFELERYRRMVHQADSVLVERGMTGQLDRRLQRLDSLRVERRVLLVRLNVGAQ